MSNSAAEDVIYYNDIRREDLGEIYKNVDGVKEREAKREIKNISSQKNIQTGRDAGWSRCYRLAAVGLGLLCVLLLTVITVLWIQFNHLTAERDQLQTSNTNLTAERDQLQTSYTNLTAEKDQLQTSYTNLTAERDQLQTSNTNLTAERDQLQKERDKVVRGLGLFGGSYFNSSIYYLTTNKKTWTGSRDECKQKAADLVIINSREEQEFINKTFLSTEAWLGLTDIATEGDFRWVDGSSLTIQFWWTGDPNDYQNEDCAITGFKYSKSDILTWADYPCGTSTYGLCEKLLS